VAKALDNSIGFVAQLLRRKLCHILLLDQLKVVLVSSPAGRLPPNNVRCVGKGSLYGAFVLF
jgi:hypothetical protein